MTVHPGTTPAPVANRDVTPQARPDFPAIYRTEFSYVWNTLRRLGVPARDLEDLAHDLFLVVHRQIADYDPQRPLRPWLFGIAFRLVADFRRSSRQQREVLGNPIEPTDGAPAADESMVAAQARALLMKALDALDLARRAVFVMHELDEIAIPEIAAVLGIPLNTAYSRLRLARAEVAAAARRLRAGRAQHG